MKRKKETIKEADEDLMTVKALSETPACSANAIKQQDNSFEFDYLKGCRETKKKLRSLSCNQMKSEESESEDDTKGLAMMPKASAQKNINKFSELIERKTADNAASRKGSDGNRDSALKDSFEEVQLERATPHESVIENDKFEN